MKTVSIPPAGRIKRQRYRLSNRPQLWPCQLAWFLGCGICNGDNGRAVSSVHPIRVLARRRRRPAQWRRSHASGRDALQRVFRIPAARWFHCNGSMAQYRRRAMWSARLLAILAIAGIACFTYLACWRASKHFVASALIVLGWVVVSQGFWTQISHHWFTTFFSMVAAWAVLSSTEHPKERTRYLVVAGLAAGAASMMTPTRGVLVVLAGLTGLCDLRRNKGQLLGYVIAVAVVPVCLLALCSLSRCVCRRLR